MAHFFCFRVQGAGGVLLTRCLIAMERLTWLEDKISPVLAPMGFDVVRVAITGEGGRRSLQVMADRLDGGQINIDDCTSISLVLSELFDSEDPIDGQYNLEVSSAGIDRPLTRRKDFSTFVGYEVRIQTRRPVEGRKKFQGVLEGLSPDGRVKVTMNGAQISVPLPEVSRAQLVLTDDLIATANNN